jgi:cytochrome P450
MSRLLDRNLRSARHVERYSAARVVFLPGRAGRSSMRITTPSPGSRARLDQINLADTALYTSGDAHLVWQTLRAERPIFWQAQSHGEGFWAVTRRADVRRVLSKHETFSSEGGTAISHARRT